MEFKPRYPEGKKPQQEFLPRQKTEFFSRERIVPETVWKRSGKSDSWCLDIGVIKTVVFPDLVYNKGYLVVCGNTKINQRVVDLRDAQMYGTILTRRCFDKQRAEGMFSEDEANSAEEHLQKAEYEFDVRGT